MRGEVRCGSRLCENSDVELARRSFVSITLNNKRPALAVTAERRKERKQFCAFAARARFHTAWGKRRHQWAIGRSLLYPNERTSSDRPGMSVWCHHRKSVDFSITSSVHSSLPKHLGSISKRPARFSSSHNIAPIAFFGACFWDDGHEQS